ncbi:MAG: hypothetical protein K2K76_08945, partial [Muribaculaceae bacterium]|nr:hypothetical protein [Muribaculaceae bacterium]
TGRGCEISFSKRSASFPNSSGVSFIGLAIITVLVYNKYTTIYRYNWISLILLEREIQLSAPQITQV